MRCTLFSVSIYSRVINTKDMFCLQIKIYCKIIPVPLYWRTEAFLRKWRRGSNSPRKLWTRFDVANFFLIFCLQYWYNIHPWWRADTPALLRWNLLLLRWEKSAPILFCSLIFLGWTKGGVPGGIRTRDCRTAARRANHIATPHPVHSHAAPYHIATPHPNT